MERILGVVDSDRDIKRQGSGSFKTQCRIRQPKHILSCSKKKLGIG
jgi:hypothetical protein